MNKLYCILYTQSNTDEVVIQDTNFNRDVLENTLKETMRYISSGYTVTEFSDYYRVSYKDFYREYFIKEYIAS